MSYFEKLQPLFLIFCNFFDFFLFALLTIPIKLQFMPCHHKILCLAVQVQILKRTYLQRYFFVALQADGIVCVAALIPFVHYRTIPDKIAFSTKCISSKVARIR